MESSSKEVGAASATAALPASSSTLRTPRLSLDEFNRFTASFRDPELEASYRQNYLATELPRERLIYFFMNCVYALYGALDLLTIKEHLSEILIVRWLILTPIGFLFILLTLVEPMKRYSGHLFAFGVFLAGISVVWMISVLPSEGAPPYVIGILVVFIFASCNVQMPFPIAALSFSLTAAAYSYVLLSQSRFSQVEVISGHFFMMSSVAVAIITNYVQEIRLRLIWLHNKLRNMNAKLVEELMIEATAADQSKINFLSILSHELRTPLHQIIGFTEVLRGKPEGDANSFLEEILVAARQLLSRISKMLRYADATAGRIVYDEDDYPISEIIDLAVGQLAARAADKEVEISTRKLAEGTVRIDQASTTYAIGHLIENALNASPRGACIAINGGVDREGRYALDIVDQGPGMTPEQISAAFTPFAQVEDARTRAMEGVGLGIPLAKKILTDQHAELTLFSAPGKGLTARVLFAAAQKAEAAASA